jgi:2-polyprenyl-6-hydroxyphenyl methylase / 3-demethylubiquinone-9 3-methyltransferase
VSSDRNWLAPLVEKLMLRKDVSRAWPAAAATADPGEIARFNALAEEWWRPDGAFRIVHAFNRARVAHLRERLPFLLGRDPKAARPLAGLKIIDVGCGAGLVAEPISRLGAEVIGIDASERNIAVAERHARASGAPAQYRHALPEGCANLAGTFDAALSLEVVEHVADLPTFLAALARLVAPGGILVIGTLNRTLRSFLTAILGAEYILRWLPRGTHDWRKFVTPAELELHLSRHAFKVVERCGVSLRIPSLTWTIDDDLAASYLQFHRKEGAAGEEIGGRAIAP